MVLQLRGRRLDRRALVLPLALVAWAASHYLHGIPTAGDDLVLVVAEIATTLFVSEATVKTHINRIFAKTRSRDRAQAVAYAHRHQLA